MFAYLLLHHVTSTEMIFIRDILEIRNEKITNLIWWLVSDDAIVSTYKLKEEVPIVQASKFLYSRTLER